MFAEEVKSLPRMECRQNSLATSRIKAGLHVRFWLPIAEMLDPYHRTAKAGGAAQDFYTRGRGTLRPYEMEESLALMKRYLGTPQLTFNIWFQLRPIYQDLLSKALTKADMDLVACAVREFVRLALGQPTDHEYGLVDPSVTDTNNPWCNPWGDLWCTDDQELLRFLDENPSDFASWSNYEWGVFFATKACQKLFDDADEFAKEFPRSAGHRLNMARALRPIFDRAWITNWSVTENALPYVKALLAIDFREARLTPSTADNSRSLDARQPSTAADPRLPSLADA
jgi:hypothetical protein